MKDYVSPFKQQFEVAISTLAKRLNWSYIWNKWIRKGRTAEKHRANTMSNLYLTNYCFFEYDLNKYEKIKQKIRWNMHAVENKNFDLNRYSWKPIAIKPVHLLTRAFFASIELNHIAISPCQALPGNN